MSRLSVFLRADTVSNHDCFVRKKLFKQKTSLEMRKSLFWGFHWWFVRNSETKSREETETLLSLVCQMPRIHWRRRRNWRTWSRVRCTKIISLPTKIERNWVHVFAFQSRSEVRIMSNGACWASCWEKRDVNGVQKTNPVQSSWRIVRSDDLEKRYKNLRPHSLNYSPQSVAKERPVTEHLYSR